MRVEKYIVALREIRNITHDFINAPHLRKAFALGFALYAIALFALLRGDIYYLDDRINSVDDGTWNWSRHLSNIMLSGIATFGKGTLDLSPLPQIFGICLVIISSMILIYLIRGKFDFIGVVASLPLGLSPHFLQNLSYKFDSLTMAMALFFAIVPFLFQSNKRVFCVVSVVSIICSFMLYQAANATYIILSLYFAFSAFFIKGRSFKESALFLALCAVNLIIASLIYGLTINNHLKSIGDAYASHEIIALDSRFFIDIWANLSTYATTIFNDFKQTAYIWLILLNCCLFMANIALRTNLSKIALILGATLFLTLGFALSFGLYLVLQKPIFAPRAFYGFNAFVAVIAIANVSFMLAKSLPAHATKSTLSAPPRLQKITHYISCAVVVIMAYFLISFANIYGNALTKQDKYLDFRVEILLKDLDSAILNNANNIFSLKINIGNHAVTQRFIDKYGDIATQLLIAKEFAFTDKLMHYNRVFMIEPDICDYAKEQLEDSITIITNNHYNKIEKVKNCYIVTIY